MRTYWSRSDASDYTLVVPKFVSTVTITLTSAWLFAGAAPGVALGCPTTQPSGASAAQPHFDAALVTPGSGIARPTKVAATDTEDDGDDQGDPDDTSDTIAANDGPWWGAGDVAMRTNLTEGEGQPRLDAAASWIV
jgi:hypothetical protein